MHPILVEIREGKNANQFNPSLSNIHEKKTMRKICVILVGKQEGKYSNRSNSSLI